MTKARIKIAAGANACSSVLDRLPILLKNIDMVRTMIKLTNKKKKNAPGSRRRLAMKYSVILNIMALQILYGRSVSILATASADGW